MKLSVHLLSWNSARYIPYLFASLRRQSFKDWSLLIIDNASQDDSVAMIKKELEQFPTPARIIENKNNVGFSPGHNQALKECDAEYVLLLNHDMYLQPDCFEKMVTFLDSHPEAAAVSPRLMKWNFKEASENFEKSLSTTVDALGIKIFRSRRAIEQYTQYDWNSIKMKFGQPTLEVFGVSGAFPMFRLSAVKKAFFSDGTMFDQSYESYKEDLDLAYRFRSEHLRSFVLLDVVAHHDRSGAGPREMGDSAALKNKKVQAEWVKYHSYKNHLATLYKNEYWQNFLLDFPWIFWYELKKLVYFLLYDRKVLKGLQELWKNRKYLKKKRHEIKAKRTASWREMRQWWQ